MVWHNGAIMAQASRAVCQYCNGTKRGRIGPPTQHDINGEIVWLHRECVLGYVQELEAKANPAADQ